MRIKTVNIINLKRRTDLHQAQLKTWTALGFAENQIVFHDAMDGMDYDSKHEIVNAATSDGFS